MIKFFLFFGLIILFGMFTLSRYEPQLVSTFVFALFALLTVAVVLKVGLDIYLGRKKEEEEETDRHAVLREDEGRTFYSISDYSEAARKRDLGKRQ